MPANRRRPDVLFAGHEASRTGAPLMLLYFLRWVREHTDLEFALILLDGGPLVEEYEKVCQVRVLADLREGRLSRWLERYRLHQIASLVRSLHARRWCAPLRTAPVVYCNSVTSLRVLALLGRRDRLVVGHIHELELALGIHGPESDRELLHHSVDRYVAASDLVKANLVENHGIDPDRIVRHYEFIDVAAFEAQVPSLATDLRAELGIPPDAAVIGAAGVTETRKGPDLFLALAMLLRHRDLGRPVHLVWLGANPDADDTLWVEFDIAKSGLGDIVHLLGPQAQPAPWFALFDVFALTSREDPFPLVCLETSLLGTPFVCFDNTGMVEFAGDGDCGFVVPYLDVHAMADRIEALLADPEGTAAVGRRAAERVRAYHDVSYGAPLLYADLDAWRTGTGRDDA